MTPGARPHERRRRVVRVPSVVRRAVENAARENAPSQPVKNSGKESRAEFLWPQESGKKSAINRDVAPKQRFPWRKGRKFRKKPNIFRQATLLEKQFSTFLTACNGAKYPIGRAFLGGKLPMLRQAAEDDDPVGRQRCTANQACRAGRRAPPAPENAA